MNIIIIGAAGQLGSDCRQLLGGRHQLSTPTLRELDLAEEGCVSDYLAARRADVVINCAAYTAVDKCESDRDTCRRVNADGPLYLARACSRTGSRLVHVSTDYVFDGKRPVPQAYREDDPVNPLSHYGSTKLDGERAVRENCGNHVILRTAWLYSAHGPNFLKTMLRLTLADPGAVRRVVDDQHGSLTWSFTLARQIECLLGPEIRGVVHATADGHTTWYRGACYFLEKMAVGHRLQPCATSEYPTPAHRPANSILANGVLDRHRLSVFRDWRACIDEFVDRHGRDLLREARAAVSQAG